MNKRLLLALYDRSGLGAYMPVDYKGHELAVEEHLEKFAELIVRECMLICRRHPSRNLDNNWDADAVAPDLVRQFEEHFGAEE